MIREGEQAPDFTLESDTGEQVSLAGLRGKPVVLYFYPKDDTPGCTTQACGIRDAYGEFERAGAVVLGVSPDSEAQHLKFKEKMKFPFELLSDAEEKACKLFDVIKEKSLYGKKYLGIERSTFLLDGKGVLRQEWRKVKVPGHAEEVLEAAKSL